MLHWVVAISVPDQNDTICQWLPFHVFSQTGLSQVLQATHLMVHNPKSFWLVCVNNHKICSRTALTNPASDDHEEHGGGILERREEARVAKDDVSIDFFKSVLRI